MILDRAQLKQDLFGLVGFRQTSNPAYENLIPSLLDSRSSRYVNDVNPLLNDVENIDQSIKNFSQYTYKTYSTTLRDNGGYTIGSKIEFNGNNWEYVATTASSATTPDPSGTDPQTWRQIDGFSDYLLKQYDASIDEMMDAWIDYKKVRSVIKSIYDQVLLFSGVANYRDLVPNVNNLVGLRIRMKKGERSLATIINRIGHQFTESFAGLTIYLYHSSQTDPLATFTVDHNRARSSQWTPLTSNEIPILKYISDDYDAGGDFYICYKQSDLIALGGAQAIKMDIHWQKPPCQCNDTWYNYYKQYSPFLDIIGFEINESGLGAGNTLFDPDDISLSYTNNYGLNLNLSTKCDLGYFVKQEEDLFAEALNLTFAKKLLEGMAYSTRGGNQTAQLVRQMAKKELFQNQEVYGTVEDRRVKSIKAISFDLSGLGEECFPCDSGYEDLIAGVATLS